MTTANSDALTSIIEQIAQQWDGCEFDVTGVGMVDIGDAIRRAGFPLAASLRREEQGEASVVERTAMDRFENAIREVGVVAACEWFGHRYDSEFTKETARVLAERAIQSNGGEGRDR